MTDKDENASSPQEQNNEAAKKLMLDQFKRGRHSPEEPYRPPTPTSGLPNSIVSEWKDDEGNRLITTLNQPLEHNPDSSPVIPRLNTGYANTVIMGDMGPYWQGAWYSVRRIKDKPPPPGVPHDALKEGVAVVITETGHIVYADYFFWPGVEGVPGTDNNDMEQIQALINLAKFMDAMSAFYSRT